MAFGEDTVCQNEKFLQHRLALVPWDKQKKYLAEMLEDEVEEDSVEQSGLVHGTIYLRIPLAQMKRYLAYGRDEPLVAPRYLGQRPMCPWNGRDNGIVGLPLTEPT